MAFKVFREKQQVNDTYLKLLQDGDTVLLVVADENGFALGGGYIIRILSDGSINRCAFVSDRFGFRLDESRRVVTD